MKRLLILFVAVMFVMGFAVNASADKNYYLFADFTTSGAFLGGYDVDAYTIDDHSGYLYVNRNGMYLDRYLVTLWDTDGDGVYEPNQHPDNIGPDGISGTADDAVGPMEQRTLTWKDTWTVTQLDTASTGELYATGDAVYFLGENEGDIYRFDLALTTTSVVVDAPTKTLSQLGRASDGTWYASSESRDVWSWSGTAWVSEFTWAAFPGGGHGDGLEVFAVEVSPGVYEDHVFVSDMYADYIGEYAKVGGVWTEIERYVYPGSGATIVVEGMGAGGIGGHFWATGSNHLYEFGGGALPPEEPNGVVPEPTTMLLLGTGLFGLALYRRRRS